MRACLHGTPSPSYHAQFTRHIGGIERHPGLLQNPRFNLFVVNAQQVKRTADVVLLSHTLGRMALNLCADSAGYVEPFAKTGERTAKAVQGQFQPGGVAGLAVRNAWDVEITKIPSSSRGRRPWRSIALKAQPWIAALRLQRRK